MSMFHLELGFIVTDYGTDEDLDKFLDCVLDELLDDERVADPDYTASLTAGTVEFSFSVEGDSDPRALETGMFVMRSAIHAAEGCTPGWEAEFRKIQSLIRESESLIPA